MRRNAPLPPIQRLRRVPGLETCPVKELMVIDSLVVEKIVPAGRVLHRRGERTTQLLLVVAGEVHVRHPHVDDPSVLMAGAFIGLRTIRDRRPDPAEVVAASEVEVLVVAHHEVDDFLALPAIERLLDRSVAQLPAPLPSGTTSQVRNCGTIGGIAAVAPGGGRGGAVG